MANQFTPRYWMIVNVGTLLASPYARAYGHHLIESEMWLDGEGGYRDTIAQMQEDGAAIMLDNGAHHYQKTTPDVLYSIAVLVRPHYLILPDTVGGDTLAVRDECMAFARKCESAERLRNTRLIYAPQGQDEDDIVMEYEWAIRNLDPARYTIGFGQSYLSFQENGRMDEDARIHLMTQCAPAMTGNPDAQYHVLGARWRPRPMGDWFRRFNFTGLDTIKPCACAIAGTLYPTKPPSVEAHRSCDRVSGEKADEELLRENVKALCQCYGCKADDVAYW